MNFQLTSPHCLLELGNRGWYYVGLFPQLQETFKATPSIAEGSLALTVFPAGRDDEIVWQRYDNILGHNFFSVASVILELDGQIWQHSSPAHPLDESALKYFKYYCDEVKAMIAERAKACVKIANEDGSVLKMTNSWQPIRDAFKLPF